MKRGFLNSKKVAPSWKVVEKVAAQPASDTPPVSSTDEADQKHFPQQEPHKLSQAVTISGSTATTRLHATNPTIVCADFRTPTGTHFLYLPQGKAEIVFMDYLQDLYRIMQWPIGASQRHQ